MNSAPRRPLKPLSELGCVDGCEDVFKDGEILTIVGNMYNLLDYRVDQSGDQTLTPCLCSEECKKQLIGETLIQPVNAYYPSRDACLRRWSLEG